MAPGLIIHFTEEQITALKPLIDKMADDERNGIGAGMLLAQVYADHMDVGFVEHETARLLVESQGGDPSKRITTAYDKCPVRKI